MIARMETQPPRQKRRRFYSRLAKRSLFDPMIVRSALPQSLRKLAPRGTRPRRSSAVVVDCRDHHTGVPARLILDSPKNVFNGHWSRSSGSPSCLPTCRGHGRRRGGDGSAQVRSAMTSGARLRATSDRSFVADLRRRVGSAGETIRRTARSSSACLRRRVCDAGESAPVIPRGRGGVVRGDGWLWCCRIGSSCHRQRGQTIDRMIALVESAARQLEHRSGRADILLS